jgi:hypothetical protein
MFARSGFGQFEDTEPPANFCIAKLFSLLVPSTNNVKPIQPRDSQKGRQPGWKTCEFEVSSAVVRPHHCPSPKQQFCFTNQLRNPFFCPYLLPFVNSYLLPSGFFEHFLSNTVEHFLSNTFLSCPSTTHHRCQGQQCVSC